MTQLLASAPDRFSLSAFERPTLALGGLAGLDLSVAGRALLAPETLAPTERTTLADRWGLAKGDDVLSRVLRGATNPLVLVGLVLAVRHPIPLARNLFKYSQSLTGLVRKPGVLMRTVGGIDELYHGVPAGRTTLPEAYKAVLREVRGFGQEYGNKLAEIVGRYEQAAGRPLDRQGGMLLSARLDGLDIARKGAPAWFKPIRGSAPFERLYADARGLTDEVWDKVFTTVKGKGYTKAEMREVYDQLRNSGIGIPAKGKVEHYFPHRVARSLSEWEEQSRQMMLGSHTEREYAQQMLGATGKVSTPHAMERHHLMRLDPKNLKDLSEHLVDPARIGRLEAAIAENPAIRKYSLDFLPTMESYLHSVSRAYGWTVQGHGRDIMKGVQALKASRQPHNQVRAAIMESSYIPVALGRSTFKQFLTSGNWDSVRYEAVKKLQDGAGKGIVPEEARTWLMDALGRDRGLTSMRNIQGRVANHLYLGALGISPVAATWNMLQTVLTTVPVIGPKATLEGIKRLFEKAPRYFNARKAGMAHELALQKAYPEFGKAGLTGAPLSEEALATAWESSLRNPPNVKGVYDRAKGAMMAMFQASETIVRLTAFEGTMAKGLAEGLTVAEVAPIARRVTEATQFLSGPGNIPAFLKEAGPLLRQFGTFPARYLEFLTGPATEIGSGAQAGGLFGLFPNRNLGTLGRAMLSSGLAYEGAQEFFGQDISRGLMFGALPTPVEGSPFYPAPFVPPILSLAGGAAQALWEGDVRPLARQLPITVPGGLQLARMSSVLAPGVAEVIGRQYAGYDQKSPDGRIPLYTSRGRLRGYLTPMQLYMQALGLPPGGPGAMQREREMVQYLVAQRDRIRAARAEFLQAIVENDTRKALRIRDEFEGLYPGLKLQVRSQDLRAVHLRTMIPRLEKMLEDLPKDVRPLFTEMVTTALMQEAENLLGIDPMLLSTAGTIRQREAYRQAPPSNVLEELYQRRIKRGGALNPRMSTPRGARGESREQATQRQRGTKESGTGRMGFEMAGFGAGAPDLTPF